MQNIYNLDLKDLEEYIVTLGYKKYNANQIFDWLYKKRVTSFKEMSNIKKELIKELENDFKIELLELIKCEKDTNVTKYLFNLKDNNKIEAVLMYHDYGNSLCISTEVGCNMGCVFCQSGTLKKIRDLEAYEMILQILNIEKEEQIKITHIVLMGIGEPFDNYDNVIKFIDIINNPKGIELGSRHITISTCGLVPKIKEFMNYKQVNLAISLHAPNDRLRDKLMPINKVYNISQLMSVIKEYIKKTNRRVTFEYIMLKDINDTVECALELSELLKGINCYVNLIPYNETDSVYKRSNKDTILKFYDILKRNNINVTIRKEFGSKVSGACGQLRANYGE